MNYNEFGVPDQEESQALESSDAQKNLDFNTLFTKQIPAPTDYSSLGPAEQSLIGASQNPTMAYDTNPVQNTLAVAQLATGTRKPNEPISVDEANKQLAQGASNAEATQAQIQAQGQQPVTIQAGLAAGSAGMPFADMEKAVKTGLAAGVAKANADEAFYQEKARIELDNQKKLNDKQAAFDTKWDAAVADYEKDVASLREMAGKQVIPGKYLADMNTGASIMTGISLVAGLFGQQATGSQSNIGFEMINKAIDKDTALQQFQLERESSLKKAELGAKENMLSRMREKYKDDTAAIYATKASMYSLAEAKLGEELNKKGGATQLAASAAAQNQLAAISAKKYEMLAQLKTQLALSESMKGGDIRNLTDDQITAMTQNDKTFRDRYVQGFGPANNKNAAEKFREYAGEVVPVMEAIDRIKTLTTDFNKFTDAKTRAKIQTEMSSLVGGLRLPLTGPGILTDSERKMLLDEVIGNPNAILAFGELQKAKLDTIYNKLRNDLNTRSKMTGFPESKASQASKLINFK